MFHTTAAFFLFTIFTLASSEIFRIPIERRTMTLNATLMSHHSNRKFSKVELEHSFLVGPVTVGKKRSNSGHDNKYRVVYDTGSSNLWIFGKSVEKKIARCNDEFDHKYYATKTATYESYEGTNDKPKHFDIKYHDGTSYEGIMGYEQVGIGGAMSQKVGFAVATKIKGSTSKKYGQAMDGILGLGLQPAAQNGATPPFIQIAGGNKFDNPVFSLHLSPDGKSGEVLFGGIDTKLCKEKELHYVKLSSNREWQIPVGGLGIGDTTIAVEDTLYADVDTGSTVILVPQKVADDLIGILQSQEKSAGYQILPGPVTFIDCSQRELLPPLFFVLDGERYGLAGTEYFKPQSKWSNHCMFQLLPTLPFDYDNALDGGGNGESSPVTNVVLGLPFLHKLYTVFDYGECRIGFGQYQN